MSVTLLGEPSATHDDETISMPHFTYAYCCHIWNDFEILLTVPCKSNHYFRSVEIDDLYEERKTLKAQFAQQQQEYAEQKKQEKAEQQQKKLEENKRASAYVPVR